MQTTVTGGIPENIQNIPSKICVQSTTTLPNHSITSFALIYMAELAITLKE
jgi:hypothetical protein